MSLYLKEAFLLEQQHSLGRRFEVTPNSTVLSFTFLLRLPLESGAFV